jgi:hypothetical protein
VSAGKRYTIVKRAPRTARCEPCGITVNRLAAYRTPTHRKACGSCATREYSAEVAS